MINTTHRSIYNSKLVASVALEHTMNTTVNTFLQRSYISSRHNINHPWTSDIFGTKMDGH